MKKLSFNVVAIVLLAGCAANHDVRPVVTALAPAPPPEYNVGDEFVFSNGVIVDVQRVVTVEAATVVIQSSEIFGTMRQPKAFTNPTEWTGGKYAHLQKIALRDGDLGAMFPLEVGKRATAKASGYFNGNRLEAEATCEVLRQENIQVKAGRFDTLVIECRFAHERGQIRYVYWYAPSVGHFVSVTRGASSMELLSWKKG